MLTNPDSDLAFPPRIVVGLSGGMDSTVLLHRLAALRAQRSFELHAVHVNHGLSTSADNWSEHSRQVCTLLDVPFTVLKADPAAIRTHDSGPEAGARAMRYGLILPWMRMHGPNAVLALGHHQEDQAETFLLRALRGSSPTGLGAMRKWSARDGVSIWRPLLHEPRDALLAYAKSHRLLWIEDPSNASDDFDRNFLRNQVMPLLRSRWPQASRSFARSAQLCNLDSQELLSLDQSALQTLFDLDGDPKTLDMSGLRALDAHARARVLRTWMTERGLPPLPSHAIAEFERCLLAPREDAQGIVAWSGHQLRTWRSKLHAIAAPRKLRMPTQSIAVPSQSVLDIELPNAATLRFRNHTATSLAFTVGMRQGGEKIQLPHRPHRSSVKNLLNEHTPPWVRTQMPVIWGPDGTVWLVGDVLRSEEYRFWQDETGSSIEWQRALD